MASLFKMARRSALSSESRSAFEREARRKADVKQAAEKLTAGKTRELTESQARRLRIAEAFNRAYTRPALRVTQQPRPQVERTVKFLKRIETARASGRLRSRGVKAILER